MKERTSLLLILAHAFLGIGFFFIYVHHVRTVFESKTNSGQLTKLGRESLFRKEDALYFSFYKIIAEEKTFARGYDKLLNVTTIEFPNSVNVVNRFHILPEICIGFLYHQFKDFSRHFQVPTVTCWTIEGNNGDPVVTCDGIGDPFHFYLEFVWFLGGLTVFVLYMYSSFLSENSFGGIYAVVLYIIFHKYASKIYERPVARENFAFPFLFWQMFYLNLCIEKATRLSPVHYSTRMRFLMIAKLTFLTTTSILCWQFSSVIYATQVLILIIPRSLTLITSLFCIDYAFSQFLSNLLAYYFTYGNKKFFLSWQNGPVLALICFSIKSIYRIRRRHEIPASSFKNITLGLILAFSTQGTITDMLEKSGYTRSDDNPYSVYRDLILYWGLQRKTNFSTSLLACNNDFAEVKFEDCWELIKTLLIKPYCLYGVVLLAQFLRKWRIQDIIGKNEEKIERAKKYVLEDFLEENRVSMKEMSNKETEKELTNCLELLKQCDYDYELYKEEKSKSKVEISHEHENFINDVKKLKDQISENERRKEKSKFDEAVHVHETKPDAANTEANNGQEPAASSQKKVKTDTNNSRPKKTNIEESILAGLNHFYLYSIVQFFVFAWIGITVKKLFFLCYTQGCLLAPTLCSKFWYRKQNNIFWTVSIIVFLTSIFDPGVQNFEGEYLPDMSSGDDLEHMLEWINLNTEKDAVFGGPIEIIGTVHLATRRPIVNHPHLEMRQISDRTEAIYSIFSRQQSSDIYNQCSQLKIQYLIVAFDDCSNATDNECDILSIWDEMQPSYRKYPQFCIELINKNIPSFLKVFSNEHYGIIKMFSQSVQLNLKYNKMPEREM